MPSWTNRRTPSRSSTTRAFRTSSSTGRLSWRTASTREPRPAGHYAAAHDNAETVSMRLTSNVFTLAVAVALLALGAWPISAAENYAVGVAKVDVTPSYPVRLSGFGFRRTES